MTDIQVIKVVDQGPQGAPAPADLLATVQVALDASVAAATTQKAEAIAARNEARAAETGSKTARDGAQVAASTATQAYGLLADSTTAIAIATGDKVFTVPAGKAFAPGHPVRVSSKANPDTQAMIGVVKAYSGTVLTVAVASVIGSATRSDWTVAVTGGALSPVGAAQDAQAIAGYAEIMDRLRAAAVPDRLSLAVDFTESVFFARKSYVGASLAALIAAIPGSSFTRSTVGYYFDVDGALKSAGVHVPRFAYDPVGGVRLLKEPARTNFCRNNTFAGAVVGSPGTLPSGMIDTVTAGLAREVVAVGVENGIEYIDLRFFGTAAAGGAIYLRLNEQANTPAAQGQIWASSCFLKLVGGSLAGTPDLTIYINEYSASSGGFLGNGLSTVPTPTAAWSRPSYRRTLSFASTAYVVTNLYHFFSAGGAVDYTLRIGLPQFERDSVSSPIKTSGSTATRGADALTIGAGSWLTSAAGTLVVEAQMVSPQSIDYLPLAQIDGGSRDVQPFLRAAVTPTPGEEAYVKWGDGTAVQPRANVAADVNARIRYAARFSGTSLGVTRDNRVPTTGVANDAAGTAPLTRLIAGDGAFFSGGSVPILISRIFFWPADLGNTKLQALSNQAAWS